MNRSAGKVVRSVFKVYENLDKQIENFSRISSLRCPDGCGVCCENPNVEATILEMLPLAQEIYLLGKENEILEALDARMERTDASCILYQPDPEIYGNGRCLFYVHRPLICRLFGFAARKNKYNIIDFSPCKVIKEKGPHLAQRAQIAITNQILPPMYQESALRVASVLPSMGFSRFPINQAMWEALGYFHWKKPVKPRRRKVA